MRFGGHSRPFLGMAICGDSFFAEQGPDALLVAVVDGLGHGAEAAVAAECAVEVIRAALDLTVEAILMRCHERLRETRGAAIGLLKVAPDGRGEFCGIGNIEVLALNGGSPSLFCQAGIVGHNLRRSRVQPVAMQPGDVYCLTSDGVSTRGDLRSSLPGPPEAVARRIVEKWGRTHDDATALVVGFAAETLLSDGTGGVAARAR